MPKIYTDFPEINRVSYEMLTQNYQDFIEDTSDGVWSAGFKSGPCMGYAVYGILAGNSVNLNLTKMIEFRKEFSSLGVLKNKSIHTTRQ
ncbi:hypothetical protein L3V83_15265 [Thiotrichales bacterium 19X7-9]|nr:hypothetical protein [Thiotrichales bacterium 19X7-9]